jgi:phosphate-selective porin
VPRPSPTFAGYYLQASYFITGESRGYKKAQGCFDTLKPKENAFGLENGLGAWEVAARMSSLDHVDDSVDGGELDDVSVGVNWYLNPNTRVIGRLHHGRPRSHRRWRRRRHGRVRAARAVSRSEPQLGGVVHDATTDSKGIPGDSERE